MRSYVKPILNGNVELDLVPFTLAMQLQYKQTFAELGLDKPARDADVLELDIYYNAQACCLFFVLCEDLRIEGDLDIPDLDMLNAFWDASAQMSIKDRWAMWQTHVTETVGKALYEAITKPDDRLSAPPALQSTEKKRTLTANGRVSSAMP